MAKKKVKAKKIERLVTHKSTKTVAFRLRDMDEYPKFVEVATLMELSPGELAAKLARRELRKYD